jgi:hypothetical protein
VGEKGRLDYEKTKDDFYAAVVAAGLGHLREKPDPVTFHDTPTARTPSRSTR